MSWIEGFKAMMEGPDEAQNKATKGEEVTGADEVRAEKAQDEESDINVNPNVSRVAKTVISLIAVIVAMAILVFVLATKMAGSVTAATAAAPTNDKVATTVATPTNSAVTAASTEPIYWRDIEIDRETAIAVGFTMGYDENKSMYVDARRLLLAAMSWCQRESPLPFTVETTNGNPFVIYDGKKVEVLPYTDSSVSAKMRELDPYIIEVRPHLLDEVIDWSSAIEDDDLWVEVTASVSTAWGRDCRRYMLVEDGGIEVVLAGEDRETVFIAPS